MLRIDVEEFSPRVSVDRPRRSLALPLSPLKIIDGLSRKSFSYCKLPVEPLKLSVLKLDGSSFDIEVMATATIGELKLAVEAVFCQMPKKGPGMISWPHVWGHFCLCYEGQKLVAETDNISNYGIKDGDQLYFIRHISNTYIVMKSRRKKKDTTPKQEKWTLSESTICEENEWNNKDDDDFGNIETGDYEYYEDKSKEIINKDIHNCPGMLRGWLPYTRLPISRKTKRRDLACASAYGCSFFNSFREIIRLCGRRNSYRRDRWRWEKC